MNTIPVLSSNFHSYEVKKKEKTLLAFWCKNNNKRIEKDGRTIENILNRRNQMILES